MRLRRTTTVVIVAGCLIALITFGLRTSLGLFTEPLSVVRGWDRETFALAIAIQNLMWGLGQPFAGAVADRYGAGRVLAVGGVIYAGGTVLMATEHDRCRVRAHRRRADRARPLRRLLRDRARGVRAARAARAALVGARHRHRGRLARPVPVRPARPGLHHRVRPGHGARAAVGLRRPRPAARVRADRPRRPQTSSTRSPRSRRARRSAPRSRTRATCCSPPASSSAASTSPSSARTCRPTSPTSASAAASPRGRSR